MQIVVGNQSQTVIVANNTTELSSQRTYILKNGEQRNQIIFRYKVNMQLKDQV
jgi:hypothetical protein